MTTSRSETLLTEANTLVTQGRIREARALLDEAAGISRDHDRLDDEARCLLLAATLARIEGSLDDARDRCLWVLSLAGRADPPAGAADSLPGPAGSLAGPVEAVVWSARTELGEIALAAGDPASAVASFDAALEVGAAAGVSEASVGAVLRRRALAHGGTGQYSEAVTDTELAAALFDRCGDRAGANRARVEQATALRHAGLAFESRHVVDRTLSRARRDGDHAVLADLHLLLSADALDHGNAGAARSAAEAARTEALAAGSPAPYLSASFAMADLSEVAGDEAGAYAALATGWATVSDLLGPEAARLAYEPRLRALRERLGSERFDDVKRSYEARSQAGKSFRP